MRIDFNSSVRPTRIAKSIHKHLENRGFDPTYGRVRKACAAMFGYRSWNDLLGQAGRSTPSLSDQDAGSAVAMERAAVFSGRLSEALGIPLETASEIVSSVGPTSKRPTEPILDDEVCSYAFPLLTDDGDLSFPITDRQSLNHFLVYGPKSAARSRLLLDIAEARVRRGSGLLHVSTQDDGMARMIEERTRGWAGLGQVAATIYSGNGEATYSRTLDRVFNERWIVFVLLPDPASDPEAAEAAEAQFCMDLTRMSRRIGDGSIAGHWRREYNGGNRIFTHAPTPIVFDDASRYVGGLNGVQAAMLKGLGFSIVHGLEDVVAFGAHDPKAAADVLANAMTKVVMGDEITVTCGRTQMPRLGSAFFQATAEIREQQSRPRMSSPATAI